MRGRDTRGARAPALRISIDFCAERLLQVVIAHS